MYSLVDQFDRAVKFLKELPQDTEIEPTNDEKLKQLYGAYKQATSGSCNIAKPPFWDIVAKSKDAWSDMSTKSRDQAMETYVDVFIQGKLLKRYPKDLQPIEFNEQLESNVNPAVAVEFTDSKVAVDVKPKSEDLKAEIIVTLKQSIDSLQQRIQKLEDLSGKNRINKAHNKTKAICRLFFGFLFLLAFYFNRFKVLKIINQILSNNK
ncbi:Acyl-CoA-binding protein, ACBP domain-containing protein [Rozella allomycis CSF55]|uniref:Acyl-CoA-binding protein, ACBP domain-containing protein n=1 Tax=Rozella allomycis (strain CSF55) TaxID=988480 RepID=A0A075B0V9_ROZAC|nr:Acyl-CoA-binding protein, ACBP domain-containing protein [Rozella allomycis CSF55]|eukprot:EPZ36136.1 Acyl-CoA-binding protein, ACBP domain-containing protein [Rozella allomycis CSF55]